MLTVALILSAQMLCDLNPMGKPHHAHRLATLLQIHAKSQPRGEA